MRSASALAASTHPFAQWREQHHTDKDRYRAIAGEMEVVARRALICGMHVHIGIEDPELRIDLMNQIRYFLPHLLALSTSSPFWGGEDTGLMCYRLSVFHNLVAAACSRTEAAPGPARKTPRHRGGASNST